MPQARAHSWRLGGFRYFCLEMEKPLDLLPLSSWIPGYQHPLVISGPCSAESREQVLETARQLSLIPQVKILRAGIWKPRTRPSSFEGVGAMGLQWLAEAKANTGLLTAVEVAKPEHIEACLEHHIDVLWLGARTVVNPFVVQELAEALQGTDIPVMVKNPLHPDIQLWLGALERLNKAGIRKLVAIHRGFYYYKHSLYRNQPMWEIPIELKRLLPDMPLLCDPSHICGRRDLIKTVSQKAMDLEMNGLIIESHCNPDQALTDARQQLHPNTLQEVLSGLQIKDTLPHHSLHHQLEQMRREIDKMDAELIDILDKRMRIVEDIGRYKRENNITILQLKRWRDMINDRLDMGTQLGLNKEFLMDLLRVIHEESIKRQE